MPWISICQPHLGGFHYAQALAAFRIRIINSLDDSTLKYSNDIIDEALRKVLNEYTRAFPNIKSTSVTVATAGRTQTLTSCTNLMNIIQLVHPYVSTAADPFCNEREDFTLTWLDGSPMAYFIGDDIPQVTEVIFVQTRSQAGNQGFRLCSCDNCQG